MTRIATAALISAVLAVPAQAQEKVDVSRLPLDLQRIQKQLRESSTREEREGLNLRYFVDVYGQAPPLVIFGPEDDLSAGPVPRTAPTHQDMVNQVTPQEYRAPAADLNNLFQWIRERVRR
jgi:hypothetical protein